MRARRFGPAAVALLSVIGTAGCASDGGDASTSAPASMSADERAVGITTTACGDASRTSGSGVVVDRGKVLTAAHVVVGATEVLVDAEPAVVAHLDRSRDLALLDVAGLGRAPAPGTIELAQAEAGAAVRIVQGGASGTIDAVVTRAVSMDVDDVRSTDRSVRAGYELDAAIAGGDSGAGVYDTEDRLVGIVFATSAERTATFAVGVSEIRAVLDAPPAGPYRCDPAQSELVAP